MFLFSHEVINIEQTPIWLDKPRDNFEQLKPVLKGIAFAFIKSDSWREKGNVEGGEPGRTNISKGSSR